MRSGVDLTLMDLFQRYHELKDTVARLASFCGRDPAEVTILAVSKGHPWEELKPCYDAGCRQFGENRVQEAELKIEKAPKDIHWHFIGALQKNKVNKVIGKYTMIHSVDDAELAEKISISSEKAELITPILLQVNTSGESTKQGMSGQEWGKVMSKVRALPGIQVEGLMTMAPLTEDEKIIRNCFISLRELRDHWGLKHLSMGMSQDYPIAIQEGATFLRIGTALFNP